MPKGGAAAFYQPSKDAAKASSKGRKPSTPPKSSEPPESPKKKKKKAKAKAKEPTPPPEDGSEEEDEEDEEDKPAPKPQKRGRGSSRSSPPPAKKPRPSSEPPALKPVGAAWGKAMYALDPTANEQTRISQKFEKLYMAVRLITRLGSLATNYLNVIVSGITTYGVPDELHPVWDCKTYNDIAESYLHFPLFLEWFPNIEPNIDWLHENPDVVSRLADFVEKVAIKVRGDDLARLRPMIIKLARIPNVDNVLDSKANRGWESPLTGELLVPVRFLARFRKDPAAFCRLAKKGEIHIFSGDWPVLLYDMQKYKAGDFKTGLLQSPVLEAAFRLLFISKTFAEGNDVDQGGKGQPPIAKKYGMKSVTLGSIIYTAVLARSCLTSFSEWKENDGLFWNCHEFAVSLFEFAYLNADWCDELLAWWTKRMFGSSTENDEEVMAEIQETAHAVAIRTQCTGRRKRATAPQTPPRSPSPAKDADATADDSNPQAGNDELEYADPA
ncbi:hypothetical protein C8T65DRAFT_741076 [Cerioporus squamosus]|nr:hypothetical protein C8T65DRAFT_741076 [Cerioporus squamosus]